MKYHCSIAKASVVLISSYLHKTEILFGSYKRSRGKIMDSKDNNTIA